ncbi:Sok2p KNAG_0M02110 [Huiozyma naganishii CBS 8797]|uniref:HTH APSES-type domain-containing protein n=1 Tax=Huiozyma naganishii (strain ATCC MYA-139 / BCRC 22969 / CBS 8797 / KCTC 17520 / NBRC 10181 / NCYC 3082 / Yp74L-3) TaxID=1071383 RepID=J7SAU7_HUIN7|nr:hypothetical protein KNAG_0M02110 [Kazachstania naganishii CBS 8797]CCK73064.1 hypothetical protein KNAG_0M02110 [Kazachstania naganishii CBS 8797]
MDFYSGDGDGPAAATAAAPSSRTSTRNSRSSSTTLHSTSRSRTSTTPQALLRPSSSRTCSTRWQTSVRGSTGPCWTPLHRTRIHIQASSNHSSRNSSSSSSSNRNNNHSSSSSLPRGNTLTTTLWEDENTVCYQVEVNSVCVVRRADNDFVNGTKLLNVTRMTRGRRDGILKAERTRHVVKIGAMHLKGVWVPLDAARAMAHREQIADLLYPLLEQDMVRYINTHPGQVNLLHNGFYR